MLRGGRRPRLSSPAVTRYIDLLVDLCWSGVCSPFMPTSASGWSGHPRSACAIAALCTRRLAIATLEPLYDHPAVGPSWEGFVLETLITAPWRGPSPSFIAPRSAPRRPSHRAARRRALGHRDQAQLSPRAERGFYAACADLRPQRRFLIYAGNERVPLPHRTEAVALHTIASELASMTRGRVSEGAIGGAVLRCVRDVALSGWWKSSPQEVTACVAEDNCVAVRRGGEQSEANEQPGGLRTRFGGVVRRACRIFSAKPRVSRRE